MRLTTLLVVAVTGLAAAACAPEPIHIQSGDTCYRCRRDIVDTRLAGQIITVSGPVLKFRTVGCLAQYLHEHPDRVRAIYVTDYTSGHPVRASSATYVHATVDAKVGEQDYLAFRSEAEAGDAARARSVVPVGWVDVMRGAAIRAAAE